MHIAQGVFKAMNVNKCTAAGGTFIFWVADWFALMNDKMGGDLAKIRDVGRYLVEVWKAAGMRMDGGRVVFRWASDDITEHAASYWPQMLDIARRFTLARIMKCGQIMGRKEGSLTAAQILYPLMQCTDVFYLKADVCQLGVDQRKAGHGDVHGVVLVSSLRRLRHAQERSIGHGAKESHHGHHGFGRVPVRALRRSRHDIKHHKAREVLGRQNLNFDRHDGAQRNRQHTRVGQCRQIAPGLRRHVRERFLRAARCAAREQI